MTDQSTEQPDHGLAIVPTLKGWLELTERVEQLEASVPATVPDDEQLTLQGISDRLDRHRRDIEDIKSRWNDLIRYLHLQPAPTPPAAAAAPTPETYQ